MPDQDITLNKEAIKLHLKNFSVQARNAAVSNFVTKLDKAAAPLTAERRESIEALRPGVQRFHGAKVALAWFPASIWQDAVQRQVRLYVDRGDPQRDQAAVQPRHPGAARPARQLHGRSQPRRGSRFDDPCGLHLFRPVRRSRHHPRHLLDARRADRRDDDQQHALAGARSRFALRRGPHARRLSLSLPDLRAAERDPLRAGQQLAPPASAGRRPMRACSSRRISTCRG